MLQLNLGKFKNDSGESSLAISLKNGGNLCLFNILMSARSKVTLRHLDLVTHVVHTAFAKGRIDFDRFSFKNIFVGIICYSEDFEIPVRLKTPQSSDVFQKRTKLHKYQRH